MKDHDKARSEIQGFILFKKQAGNNAVYGMEQAVKERTVMEEKRAELFVNSKNTMAVWDIDQFKGHRGRALHGVEISTGRTKAAVAAERDKL